MRDDFKVPKKPAMRPHKPARVEKDLAPPKLDDPEDTIVIDGGDVVAEKVNTKKVAAKHGRLAALIAWWKSLDRNVRFGVIAAGLTVFLALALGVYYFTQPGSNPSYEVIKKNKAAPVSNTVASPLTGVQVDPSLAARPVTGIMIENSDFARPQSGLQDAGVVYEAIAEAGITRFLALFQEGTPQYIGPVRSLRPYYIDYAAPFQASIVHVGGSPDALKIVQNGDYRNLDQFFNAGFFSRISSRDAPHNVYTNFKALDKLERSKGYTTSKFTSWPRKADDKPAKPDVTSIDFKISGPDYYVHYDYYQHSNSYLRSEGGTKHTEIVNASGSKRVRLAPKVVIALVVPLKNGHLDSSGAYYSNYHTSGTGDMFVFQDGAVTKGTWRKNGTNGQITFTNRAGHPLKLDAGQTWITLVSDPGQVVYQ
ncbi:MAG TPA: DUF3048 domain-containing protein [Candidatus Saccharimonadales bacterium]|nr:DUF3048 domain-containing protein [Candidatus Saccharimonadales bacterium]